MNFVILKFQFMSSHSIISGSVLLIMVQTQSKFLLGLFLIFFKYYKRGSL